MAAYFIAHYVVNNPELYREYQVAAAATIQAAGGEMVAFDVAAETGCLATEVLDDAAPAAASAPSPRLPDADGVALNRELHYRATSRAARESRPGSMTVAASSAC